MLQLLSFSTAQSFPPTQTSMEVDPRESPVDSNISNDNGTNNNAAKNVVVVVGLDGGNTVPSPSVTPQLNKKINRTPSPDIPFEGLNSPASPSLRKATGSTTPIQSPHHTSVHTTTATELVTYRNW
jgi:hypothetical protein